MYCGQFCFEFEHVGCARVLDCMVGSKSYNTAEFHCFRSMADAIRDNMSEIRKMVSAFSLGSGRPRWIQTTKLLLLFCARLMAGDTKASGAKAAGPFFPKSLLWLLWCCT